MDEHQAYQPDYGSGQKKLSIYLIGVFSCIILTLISFWVVMANTLTRGQIFTIIYFSAFIQFFVQLICFLRLNIQTEQGKTNVMGLIFTAVILTTILLGSLWIMSNLDYNMIN